MGFIRNSKLRKTDESSKWSVSAQVFFRASQSIHCFIFVLIIVLYCLQCEVLNYLNWPASGGDVFWKSVFPCACERWMQVQLTPVV